MAHNLARQIDRFEKEMGYETAGATLGRTNMSATAIDAERNQGLADEAARRFERAEQKLRQGQRKQ